MEENYTLKKFYVWKDMSWEAQISQIDNGMKFKNKHTDSKGVVSINYNDHTIWIAGIGYSDRGSKKNPIPTCALWEFFKHWKYTKSCAIYR